MGGSFGFLDIILFAMVAAFLVYRLGTNLGKRTGHERRRDPFGPVGAPKNAPAETAKDNIVTLPDRGAEGPAEQTPLAAGITQIKVADPSFEPARFVDGARAAFEMIVAAFAAGDRETLRSFLSDTVYNNFASAIEAREQAGHTQETTLVGIDAVDILEARMDGRDAIVTIKYVSDQANVTRDAAGETIEGDPNAVVRVTDIWTFSRDTRSSDPNWTLIGTSSPD